MRALPKMMMILGLGAALAGCSSEPPADTAAIPRPEVRVARVESRSFREAIEAPGQWKASVETVLPAPFEAVVESIAVGIGDRVRRGEVLAWCRTAESDAVLRGAEMMRRQATDARSIQDAEQAVAEARRSIVHVPITSPASGTVLRRQIDAGSRLSSGSELLAVVTDDALVFEVRVPVSESAAIRAVCSTSGVLLCDWPIQSAPSGTTKTPTHFSPCRAQLGSSSRDGAVTLPPASPRFSRVDRSRTFQMNPS